LRSNDCFLDITGPLAFLLLQHAVPHDQSQSVLAFVAIKPVGSFGARSAQNNSHFIFVYCVPFFSEE
jgi:hypothetical protein